MNKLLKQAVKMAISVAVVAIIVFDKPLTLELTRDVILAIGIVIGINLVMGDG